MAVKRLSGLEDNVAANGVIEVDPNTISVNYTLPAGQNATSNGPVTIADTITVTISSGSVWTIR